MISLAKETLNSNKRFIIAGLITIIAGLGVVGLLMTTADDSQAVSVNIDGQRVGFVSDKEEMTALIKEAAEEISQEHDNIEVIVEDESIQLEDSDAKEEKVAMLNESEMKETLENSELVKAKSYTIRVDEDDMIYLANEEEAQEVLDAIAEKYKVVGDNVKTKFIENIEITAAAANFDNLTVTPEAVNYLLTGNIKIKEYKVKDDETDWDIAQKFNITETELQRMNPDVETSTIENGDLLYVEESSPFVHIQTNATVNVKEPVKREVKKVKTKKLFKGETKVKKKGEDGEQLVTKRAMYINGKEVNAKVYKTNIIKESKAKVVYIGAMSTEGSILFDDATGMYIGGNGRLNRPMKNIDVSSPYGMRNGRMHQGVDLRNPNGTPIYAAASGTVTFAGSNGAYGRMVKISHSNGVETYYAHCSSLNVESGEKVKKGQRIASVGTTGRSTGYHLHFEVRINGSTVNPMDYI